MAKYSIDSTTLTGIGNAIRGKEGSAGGIPVTQIASRIAAIETGADVSGVTAGAADVAAPKRFVDSGGVLRTGTMVVQNYYTGATPPGAELGSDGDLYLVTGGN